MKVRVKFSKQGNMKFIGHLDVMRYFQKAIRRARIDIAYTEGLSPHMIMSFASPLGVGLTSDGEYMDIELRTPVSSREAIDALNRVGVEGIEVTGFYEIPEGKANKAMTLVAAADYVVRFRRGYEPALDLAAAVRTFCAQERIPVWKKTKKSEKEVDIRPLIYEMRWLEGDTQARAEHVGREEIQASAEHAGKEETQDASQTETGRENPGAVFLRLASGSVDNLKPELVMDTLLGMNGIEAAPFAYEINRCELYADTKSEGTRRLTPLYALGREIV